MLSRRMLIILVAMVAVAALAAQASAAVSVGDKAPGFKLDSLSGGAPVQLSNYAAKPTLVLFWVSWCPHCQRELPVVQKVYADLKGKGASVVGVNVDETGGLADARELVSATHVTFPNGIAGTDDTFPVPRAYGVRGVPALFFVDKKGVVRAIYSGEADEAEVRQGFAKIGVK